LAAVAAGTAVAAYAHAGRPQQLHWGAAGEEIDAVLPGDDLIPNPDLAATRAVTIGAAPDQVWPWLAQLGQGRGGFNGYDLLENLTGLHMQSAERVVPEWQHIGAGDVIRPAPAVGLTVAAAEPGRALVLRGGVPMGGAAPPYDFTWAFALGGKPDGTCRLLVRDRYAYTRGCAPLLVEPVQLISFVMTRRMLQGIRNRAEQRQASTARRDAGSHD
jgi:hypothetical protein